MSVWGQIQEAAVSPVIEDHSYMIFGIDDRGRRFSRPAQSYKFDEAMLELVSPYDTRDEIARRVLIRGISSVIELWDLGSMRPLILRKESVLALNPTQLGMERIKDLVLIQLGGGLFRNRETRFVRFNGIIQREGIEKMGFRIDDGEVLLAALFKGKEKEKNLLKVF